MRILKNLVKKNEKYESVFKESQQKLNVFGRFKNIGTVVVREQATIS